MEQTTAISTQLAGLPAILEANEGLKVRAIATIDQKLTEVQNIDFKTIPLEIGDQYDLALSELQSRGADSVSINKERRAPFTKEMDRIRGIFTTIENEIQVKVESIKSWRSSWAGEKLRRKQEADKKAQEELSKKNAGSDYQVLVSNAINEHYMYELKGNILKLNQAFNSIPVIGFEEYELKLKNYQPTLVPFDYSSGTSPYLSEEEMVALKTKVQNELYPILNGHYSEEMGKERDRLIELIPSRIDELRRIAQNPEAAAEAENRIVNDELARMQELNEQQFDMQQAAVATAESEKLSNMFEATAAQPAISLSKGTSVKQKYVAKTHKAVIAIITWWVQTQMQNMTIEELTKKFSFMFTAANKELNKGTRIESEELFTEDDITVRGAR